VSPPHYWSTTGGSPPLAAMTAWSLLGILRAKVLHRSLVTSGPVQCTTLSLNHRDLRPLSASIGGCHWHKFWARSIPGTIVKTECAQDKKFKKSSLIFSNHGLVDTIEEKVL